MPSVRPQADDASAGPAADVVLPPARVLVADDADGVRELVVLLLDMEPDFTVVGQARDGVEVIDLAGRLQPDLVVLDVSMPQLDGLTALPRVLHAAPRARVVLFTSFDEPEIQDEARRAGATALVPKDAPVLDLVDRLRDGLRV